MGLKFKIIKPQIDEKVLLRERPTSYVTRMSREKAFSVLHHQFDSPSIIISADTIVVFKNKILGKPKNKENAKQMLKAMSGKLHFVFTSVTILKIENKNKLEELNIICKTKVTFAKLSSQEITSYVATKEPLDKAGAYGAQGYGSLLIKKIEGSYFNVVGLPVQELFSEMKKKWGIDFW